MFFDWGNGTLTIGGQPTSFDFDQVSPKETFSGRITEFNFWDRTLTTDEIQGLLDCSVNITGDIIKWTIEIKDRGEKQFNFPLTFEKNELIFIL